MQTGESTHAGASASPTCPVNHIPKLHEQAELLDGILGGTHCAPPRHELEDGHHGTSSRTATTARGRPPRPRTPPRGAARRADDAEIGERGGAPDHLLGERVDDEALELVHLRVQRGLLRRNHGGDQARLDEGSGFGRERRRGEAPEAGARRRPWAAAPPVAVVLDACGRWDWEKVGKEKREERDRDTWRSANVLGDIRTPPTTPQAWGFAFPDGFWGVSGWKASIGEIGRAHV